MNRRYPESTGLPTPTTRHAGEDRFVRRHPAHRRRRQTGDKARTDPNPRVASSLAALNQSAQNVARHLQIGVTDQAVQP
jgi:hypothetical protein